MKNRSILSLAILCMLSVQSIAQNQTINGVLTVNTSGTANTVRVENDVAGEAAAIRFRSKPSSGSGWLHSDISVYATGSNTGFLGFKVPHDNSFGSGYKMVIDHNGRLGVGTTSPNSILHLKSTSPSLNIQSTDVRTNDSFFSTINLSDVNGNNFATFGAASTTNKDLYIRNFVNTGKIRIGDHISTDRLVIDNGGNIGIGTRTPEAKLTIVGDGSSAGSASINLKHAGNGMSIGLSTSSNDLIVGDSWNPETGTYLTIQDGTGKIGIGTSDFTGDHKLRVEGSIGAREIKVEASGWSDFVFENDYELLTLEEVENYIFENKHLPEIPSETEVTENGINLGEMNAKLLQKIEELTLYMIDMNKRMGQLEAENAELKTSNHELSKKVQLLENQ